MHPILFRIPLPHFPLKVWWGLVAVAAIALVYALVGLRRQQRDTVAFAGIIAAAAGGAAYFFRETTFEAPNLPIYSYGVMLGLSLVVGWYLTLTLAERDGLPKETMANCYVVTAIAALVGARLLYVVTNLDEFNSFTDIFALRRGGLVAYGGFIGGYIGSWAYLSRHKIRLMPWADVAVPSLASGLLITRIGCYLFGCDFGKRLPETAPEFLKKLGTFPHWGAGTLDGGEGSPAFVRHHELFRGTPLGELVTRTDASLPVHPTQIYESLVGLTLLALLLWQRKSQKFRGQIFFLFVFAYGVARFLLEILRDDTERGEYGPVMAEHTLVPLALLVLALGFVFGIALGIKNPRARLVARVLAFVPPVVAYFKLRPESFAGQVNIQLSTSQLIAVITGLMVSYFYARFWENARRSPKLAMAMGSFEEEEEERAATKKRRKRKPAPAVAAPEAPEEEDEEDEDDAPAATASEPAPPPKARTIEDELPEVDQESDPTIAAAPASKKRDRERAASIPPAKPDVPAPTDLKERAGEAKDSASET